MLQGWIQVQWKMDPKTGQFKFGKNHQKNDNEKHDLLSKNPIRTHERKLVNFFF